MPQRTPEGKWRIYDRETGQHLDRWPVDARGMLSGGKYVAEPPEGAEPIEVTPEQRGIVEKPNPTVPGLEAERKSREGTLTDADVPEGAQKAEDAPPAEPVEVPAKSTKGSRGKKGD